MPQVSTRLRFARSLRIGTIATIVAGGLLVLAPAASSQSVTPQSVDPWQHFIDCAGVLITAPDVHAANCLPSNVGPESRSLGASSDGDDTKCPVRLTPSQFDGYEDDDCYDDTGQDDSVDDLTNV